MLAACATLMRRRPAVQKKVSQRGGEAVRKLKHRDDANVGLGTASPARSLVCHLACWPLAQPARQIGCAPLCGVVVTAAAVCHTSDAPFILQYQVPRGTPWFPMLGKTYLWPDLLFLGPRTSWYFPQVESRLRAETPAPTAQPGARSGFSGSPVVGYKRSAHPAF